MVLAVDSEASLTARLGLTSLTAASPPAAQSSTRSFSGRDFSAAMGVNRDFWGDIYDDGKCAITTAASGVKSWWVVDLGQPSRVDSVAVYGLLFNEAYRQHMTSSGGTVVGVSSGWDLASGSEVANGYYDWATVGDRDCWSAQDCDTSTNVTRCGLIEEDRLGGNWVLGCPSDTVGRYVFVMHVGANKPLGLCEVLAVGHASSAVVVTQAVSGVRFEVFVKRGNSRHRGGNYDYGERQLDAGISWDDAAEQCERRNLRLARIESEAEQALVVAALETQRAFESATNPEDAYFPRYAWIGAKRDVWRPYWHWYQDPTAGVWEGNYTNWAEGFAYGDTVEAPYTWSGPERIQ